MNNNIDPMVSVFMMAYNHENYIEQAISSVLMQKTNFEFKIVIGEDCSTDKTREVIQQFSSTHPEKFILLFHNPNIGAWANQFDILSNCIGKYIAICESDDYWTDVDKLQKQVDFLESHPDFSMVFTNRQILQPDGNLTTDIYEKEVYTQIDILKGMIPATQTIMFRNAVELLPFLNQYKNFYSGDRMLSYWATLKGNIYRMSDITAVYRNSGDGVWSGLTFSKRNEVSIQSFYDFHKAIGMPNRNIFALAFTWQHISILRISNEMNFKSLKSTFRKLRKDLSAFEIYNGILTYLFNQFLKKIKSKLI